MAPIAVCGEERLAITASLAKWPLHQFIIIYKEKDRDGRVKNKNRKKIKLG